jgi:hypothetical protein
MQRRALISFAFATAVTAGVIWRRPLLNAWKEARFRVKITAIPLGAERADVLHSLAQLMEPFHTKVEEEQHEVVFKLKLLDHRVVTGPWEASRGRWILWKFRFDANGRLIDVKKDFSGWVETT